MKILVDMNLSPAWVAELVAHGLVAKHWSEMGSPRATDAELMQYAREHGYVVFTHDLDFGVLLALTRAAGPSVLQVRTQNVMPSDLGDIVVAVLRDHESALATGALVTVDSVGSRIRILPIR